MKNYLGRLTDDPVKEFHFKITPGGKKVRSKKTIVILGLFVLISLLTSCSEKATEPPQNDHNGTLEFDMSVWNAFGERISYIKDNTCDLNKEDPPVYTCELLDIRNILYKMQVADDEIIPGEPDDLNWITIYESSELLLNSEKSFVIDLPAGNYRAIKLIQSNLMYWVVTYDDNTIELPSLNASNLDPEAQILNIFGEDGLYDINEDGLFYLYHSGEKLGTFEIMPGKTTKVTLRMNIISLDWIDNDNDGNWSDGDELDNWAVPEGIETMADFVVTYED